MSTKGMTPGPLDPGLFAEPRIAFEAAEYADRLVRLREIMARERIDMLYVTTPEAVCYLHGYFASWYKANGPRRYPQLYGTVVRADRAEMIHFDNPTEAPVLAATSLCRDLRYFSSREADEVIPFIMDELARAGWLKGTVGLEFWSYLPNRAVSGMIERAFAERGCTVVDASALTREVRRRKSPAEIARIEEATRLADIGHRCIQENLRPGITELDLFGQVTAAMMAAGSEFPALIPIFNAMPVSGTAMANGHAMAGRKVIREGEVLVADLCGVVDRYHGNVCRGHYVGRPPPELVERYALAAGAFEVIRDEMRAGTSVGDFNDRLRRYYVEAGLWDEDGWALGYELGLSLPPDWVGDFYFNVRDTKYLDRQFEPGMTTNFESLYSTALIDMLVWERDRVRLPSETPLALLSTG